MFVCVSAGELWLCMHISADVCVCLCVQVACSGPSASKQSFSYNHVPAILPHTGFPRGYNSLPAVLDEQKDDGGKTLQL